MSRRGGEVSRPFVQLLLCRHTGIEARVTSQGYLCGSTKSTVVNFQMLTKTNEDCGRDFVGKMLLELPYGAPAIIERGV